MADLTNLFAKIKIYDMKKGAAAPIKSLRLVVLYCNDSYFIQLYFWYILLINSAIPWCFVKIYIINSISLFIQ